MRAALWSSRLRVAETIAADSILVIGIGNTLRRDDGAGWLFAEALASELQKAGRRVHLVLQHQLTPELAEEAAELRPSHVIFVDASVTTHDARLTPLPDAALVSGASATSASANVAGHGLSPAALLALMRRLYAVAAAGWLVQTPAEDFGHGEGLSEAAQHGVETAPRIASAFLRLNC